MVVVLLLGLLEPLVSLGLPLWHPSDFGPHSAPCPMAPIQLPGGRVGGLGV